jgi:hypothetical protein
LKCIDKLTQCFNDSCTQTNDACVNDVIGDTHVYVPRVSVSGVSLLKNYIPIVLNGRDMYGLIDSGADVSVARSSVFNDVIKDNYVELPCDRKWLLTVNKTELSVLKKVRVRLCVCNVNVHADLYITDALQTDIILGLDWLQQNKVNIDFNNNKLSIDPRRILLTNDNVKIKANSEVVLIARIKGIGLPDNVVGLTDQCPQSVATGLLAGKTMTKIFDDKVYHTVANITNEDIVLKKNTRIGKFVALSGQDKVVQITDKLDVKHTCDIDDSKNQNSNEFKPSMHINIDNEGLIENQKHTILHVVNEFSDVFVGDDGKLGFCDVIEHNIELLPNTKPFCQRAYRLPPKQKEAMQRELTNLLEQDVIEDSTSAWGVTLFLSYKKIG